MMALTIVLTTSGQKPSRASFISDGFEAGGEEEERLISKLVQVRTYAGTCCVDFISVEPKRSDRTSGNIDRMVFVNNYIFQLVEHLEQNRPVVKNPLVKLKAFDDKTLCVVTTLKEYPTRTH
ncbi:unnamed protein product [Porites lobata]|uniref:Uncharacterized protein n=1 Tax=Porites lobata TaxID=104759 RepID=A0ABN8NM40_9CNID|nr:unnamed protein product [Porites lobata]